ncbi:hypothetical protein LP421_15085 [Rhizobium sp. RCAM05350]|nr:hypothetical protein LP421_15085 [Rhizobium sp. RCAM05350]
MAGVVIENPDWLAFIDRYDRPETLFYLDPPYFGNEDEYGKALFSQGQFEIMAKRLSRLKARFIMSINDAPLIHQTVSAFQREKVNLTYSVEGRKGTHAAELIIFGGTSHE